LAFAQTAHIKYGAAVGVASNTALLGLTLAAAFLLMRDLGFTPSRNKGPIEEVRRVIQASLDNGWRNPPVRWLMLAAPFSTGVGIYAIYALQPYLLELYGDKTAFGIAGLAAAIFAGTQILGGLMVPLVRRLFKLTSSGSAPPRSPAYPAPSPA